MSQTYLNRQQEKLANQVFEWIRFGKYPDEILRVEFEDANGNKYIKSLDPKRCEKLRRDPYAEKI